MRKPQQTADLVMNVVFAERRLGLLPHPAVELGDQPNGIVRIQPRGVERAQNDALRKRKDAARGLNHWYHFVSVARWRELLDKSAAQQSLDLAGDA